ncbi:MAG: flagellar basal body-associated FliL family protein [Candidatus Firestonebacteria bacterium]|nr:flagellar basal body-associated FliL family protein [Candidatus Firestonebacteria bacterium]
MAEETNNKDEKIKKSKPKGSIPWLILSYLNILLFIGSITYFAIDLSQKYESASKSEQIENSSRGWGEKHLDSGLIVTNLADTEIQYFIKTKLKLEPDEYLLHEEANNKIPQIRDIAITVFSQKKTNDIKSAAGKNKLKKELLKYINNNLISGRFKNILFTEFAIK